MSNDPLSDAPKVGKYLKALDAVTGGAITDTIDHLFPDVNRKLYAASTRAHDDMVQALVVVARAILAAAHGVAPGDEEVIAFFNGRAADPAFAARTMRLVSQSLRSPSERRRRMLALALFQPCEDPDVRDRVDRAIEGLEPSDVETLRALCAAPAGGFYLGDRWGERGASSLNGPTILAVPWRGGERVTVFAEAIKCGVASLMRLRTAECLDLGPIGGVPVSFEDTWGPIRTLDVFDLGRRVVTALKDERAILDIETSAR